MIHDLAGLIRPIRRRDPTSLTHAGDLDNLKAVILSAGQGKRLLPLTADKPKALLPIGAHPLFAWQIASLVQCGISDIVIVTGYGADKFDETLAEVAPRFPGARLRTLYNDIWDKSDNLASCWQAREEMREPFLLINGDTLFQAELCETLLASPPAPITLAVDRKTHYDDDDMKVRLDGKRLLDIGKTLTPAHTQAESIGMLRFSAEGAQRFVDTIGEAMSKEDGSKKWFLSAIATLAKTIEIETCLISGHPWCEVDYPLDLKRAYALVSDWPADDAPGAAPDAATLR